MPNPTVTDSLQVSKIYRVKGQTADFYPNVDQEMCALLENMNITSRGSAQRAPGYAKYNTTVMASGVAVTGLKQQTYKAGTALNIETAGTKVYYDDGTTRTDITGTLTLTNNADARYRFAYIDDKVVATNGADETWYWDGSTSGTPAAVALTGMPWTTCDDLFVHKNVLVALAPTESAVKFPTRARWCDVNRTTFVVDITSWPDANRFEVIDEGPAIVGGCSNFGRILIFKQDGLFPCDIGYSEGHIDMTLEEDQQYSGFSPIARDSIVSRPEFTFVIAMDGAYVIIPEGDTFSVKMVTGDLRYDWQANLNMARLQYAQSWVREKDKQVRTLISSASNTTGHDLILVWDWDANAVWFDEPAQDLNYGTMFRVSSVEYDLLGTYDGYVMKGNTGASYADSDISWTLRTVSNDLGMPNVSKQIVSVNLRYREKDDSQAVLFTCLFDEDTGTPVSKPLTLGSNVLYDIGLEYDTGLTYADTDATVVKIPINRIAETVQIQLTGTDDFELVGWNAEFIPLESGAS